MIGAEASDRNAMQAYIDRYAIFRELCRPSGLLEVEAVLLYRGYTK